MSDSRIVILGAGAAGSYLGAYMTREGHDVTLLDMWGEHVEAMRSNGLRASGTQDDFTTPVRAFHLSDAMQLREQFDIGFLAVKSYDTEWSAHFLKRLIRHGRCCRVVPELYERPARGVRRRLRPRRWLHHVQHHRRPLGAGPRHEGRPSGSRPRLRRLPRGGVARTGDAQGRGDRRYPVVRGRRQGDDQPLG